MNGEDDAETIASPMDEDGDEVDQDHPIENPGGNGGEDHDAIAEPHPDEPGAPDDAGEGAGDSGDSDADGSGADEASGAEETSRPADD